MYLYTTNGDCIFHFQLVTTYKKHETVNRDEGTTYRYQIPTIEYVQTVEYAQCVRLIHCSNVSLCSVNGEMRYLKMLWNGDEDVEV